MKATVASDGRLDLISSHSSIHGKPEILIQVLHTLKHWFYDSCKSQYTSILRDIMDESENSGLMTEEYIHDHGYSATEILSRSETQTGHGYETDNFNNKETFQAWISAPNTGHDKNVRWPEYPLNLNASWIKHYQKIRNTIVNVKNQKIRFILRRV